MICYTNKKHYKLTSHQLQSTGLFVREVRGSRADLLSLSLFTKMLTQVHSRAAYLLSVVFHG